MPAAELYQRVYQAAECADLAEAIADAAAIEAIGAGHVRVIAARLRRTLERLQGPAAEVISIVGERAGRER